MKKITLVFFCALLTFISFAQKDQRDSSRHGKGAILLSKSEYAKLPKADLDEIRKFRRTDNVALTPTSAMLVAPPIGNQGLEGSCVGWGFGYTAMSIISYSKYNNDWAKAKRSPEYVYDQIRLNPNDCANAGSYPRDAANLCKSKGVCSWSLMPYSDANGCNLATSSAQNADAAQNKALDYRTLNTNDVDGIKTAIASGYPVPISINCSPAWYDMWYGDGIWRTNNSGGGGHCVCIIGYDDNKQMFKVQNQWGTGGGDNGYFWVTYNLVRQDWAFNEVYVIYPAKTVTTCSAPQNVTATPLSQTSESISWASSGAQSYFIKYKLHSATQFTNGPSNITGTSATLTGLAASAVYDVDVYSTCANGTTPVTHASFTTSAPQVITNGIYNVKSLCNGLYMDVYLDNGMSMSDGATVDQWSASGNTDQKWKFTSLGNNVYTITSVLSGRNLDVAGAGMANGSKIQLYHSDGTDVQKWKAIPAGNGSYYLQSVASGLNLDVPGNSKSNGVQLQIWTSLNDPGQQWTITAASAKAATARTLPKTTLAPVSVYPNPTHNVVTLNGLHTGAVISVYNSLGQPVLTKTVTRATESLSLGKLATGIYIIKVSGPGGNKEFKIVKD